MSEHVTILVVDDDALDRMAVRRALKASGLMVDLVEADNGADALTTLAERSFDVILLDYRLPGTDGLELLRSIRAAGIHTPLIVMTGQGDEQLAVEIMKAGAADYLSKGRMSAEILASSVRHAQRVHQAEMQAVAAEEQRKQAEDALSQNERLLTITLKSIGDALIAADASGRVTFMNTVAEQLTGWSAAEAIGQPFEVVLPLTSRADSSMPQRALGESTHDTLAQTRTGRQFPVVTSSAPIRNDDGTPVGVVVVFHDISERVRMEERLRFLADLSQRLASSLDYQAHLSKLAELAVPRFADLCLIDLAKPENTIERVAYAATEPVERILAQYVQESAVLSSQSYGSARVIETGQTEYYEQLPATLLDQFTPRQRTFVEQVELRSMISVPLVVRGGMLGAITFGRVGQSEPYLADDVAFAEEIARRAALAVDNALLYREAQDAIQARDAFLSIASHELRTPLTSLLGYAELLQRRIRRGAATEERSERVMQVMIDQARRLNKMVQALFDLSRLQTGQLSIERTTLDLCALVTRIISETEPTLEHHTLRLEGCAEELIVQGDELRLEQVIQNLIQNAIKYSPNGGLIRVALTHEPGWIGLSVEDHGLGIPPESLPRIFRRFYRAAHAEPYQIGGLGVGLYVAKQIVDLHGGRVEVESTEGVGSTFVIWLPAEQPIVHAV